MTDVYTQESASKKKFLAPLLVILLCMVSLTAAGYAYSATVSAPDQDIPDADDLAINFANGNPGNSITVTAKDVIVFTDNIEWEYDTTTDPLNPQWVSSDRVDAYANDIATGNIAYALTITGEGVANKIEISSADLEGYLAKEIGNGVTIGDLVSVKVNTVASLTGAKDLSETAVGFEVSKAADESCPVTVYLYFVPVDNAAHTVKLAADDGLDANGFKLAFESYTEKFSITFAADSEPMA